MSDSPPIASGGSQHPGFGQVQERHDGHAIRHGIGNHDPSGEQNGKLRVFDDVPLTSRRDEFKRFKGGMVQQTPQRFGIHDNHLQGNEWNCNTYPKFIQPQGAEQ